MIRVYCDEGVSIESVQMLFFSLQKLCNPWKYAVSKISATELAETDWETNCVLLVFPGGAANPYHRKLSNRVGNRGNHRIRMFVENGGHYLGICAGAYYGCSHIEFDRGGPLEILCDYELGFFSGIGKGPAMKGFDYTSDKGAHASHFRWKESEGIAFFQGGPSFVIDSHQSCKEIAWFCDQPELACEANAPGCIACEVGKGCAVLCAFHIEFDPWISKISHRLMEELRDPEGKSLNVLRFNV